MARAVPILPLAKIAGGISGAIVGSGALLALLVGLGAVRAQRAARVYETVEAPQSSGVYGEEFEGSPLQFALLGDSLAVGVGAEKRSETVGAILARGISSLAGRRVMLQNVAETGSQSKDLGGQLAALGKLMPHPDIAVIIVGGNDVMQRARVAVAVRHLYRAVLLLRQSGCHVVVGTCPDMGTVRPLNQPLRLLARQASRLLAAAQTAVVIRAGGRPVPLGDALGRIFWHKPKLMFAADHFHPSALGYARSAALLLPSVWAAVDPGNHRDRESPSGLTVAEATSGALAASR